MLTLRSGQVDIWLTFLADIKDEHLWFQYRQLLSEDELIQMHQFRFEKDKKRYLATRALVRTVLSKYISLPPSEWTFAYNQYGKPTISHVKAIAHKLTFNLSHTEGLIVLGISCDRLIGVDTENIHVTDALTEGLDLFLSPDEIAHLSTVYGAEYQTRFFEYWTLKEAYIKAKGAGFSLPLQQITFYLQQKGQIDLAFHPQWDDDASQWHCWQFSLLSDYLLAVCVERPQGIPLQITLKKYTPLLTTHRTEGILLRQSHSISPNY